MSSPGFERITRILACFDGSNRPLQVSEVIVRTDLPTSTAYALIRAMVQENVLERHDHGQIKLGKAARRLAFCPIEGRYASAARETHGAVITNHQLASKTGTYQGGVGWLPELNEKVDTARFVKQKPWKIGFANASLNNPWRHALLQSLEYGVGVHRRSIQSCTVKTANDSTQKQLEDIAELMALGIDGLIISAAGFRDEALEAQLTRLVSDGVPVIALDRRLAAAESAVTFVTASDAQIGHLSAVWLSEHLKGKGRVWMLSGADGASPALRRQSSALAAFSQFSGIKVEAVAFTGWTSDGGRKAIRDLLEQEPSPPDAVWCDSGLQGIGSIAEFVAHGLQPPPHTGGDLNAMYRRAIELHVPFVAVDYPAAMGALAVDTMVSILSGHTVTRRIETPIQIVLPRGCETASIKADQWAEQHVRWDQPGDVILSQGASLKPYRFTKNRGQKKRA